MAEEDQRTHGLRIALKLPIDWDFYLREDDMPFFKDCMANDRTIADKLLGLEIAVRRYEENYANSRCQDSETIAVRRYKENYADNQRQDPET